MFIGKLSSAFLLGILFFPATYMILCRALENVMPYLGCKALRIGSVSRICMRLVSAAQAILACISGVLIASSCQDMLHDRHWLTDPYVCFATAYLVYDTVIMVHCFLNENPSFRNTGWFSILQGFIKNDNWNTTILLHHLLFPMVLLPIILYFRRGLGDYFIGILMLIEAFIPFVSIRDILLQIGIRDGYLYILNGVAALVTFAFCRILIFPFLFWKYSSYLDISVTELPLRIPLICTLGSIILVCIFSYWLYKMSSMAKMELHWKSPHRTSRKNLISCR